MVTFQFVKMSEGQNQLPWVYFAERNVSKKLDEFFRDEGGIWNCKVRVRKFFTILIRNSFIGIGCGM